MGHSSVENVKAIIDTYEPKLKTWAQYEKFMNQLLNSIITKMDIANKMLVQKMRLAVQAKLDLDGLTSEISTVVQESLKTSNADMLHRLEQVMNSQGLVDQDIKAVLGIIHYNILLQKRLTTFKELGEKLSGLHLATLDPVEAKKLLLKYGNGLQLVWDECLQLCPSSFERELVDKVISNKD